MKYSVDRTIFVKFFVLQYPEFIRFLKDKNLYKRFFRALSLNNGLPPLSNTPFMVNDRTMLKRVIDVAFSWYVMRNDNISPERWSGLSECWQRHFSEYITEDNTRRKKIKIALLKTHMVMYKHKPFKQLKACLYDLIAK